jgi:hypothetical protein
LSIQYFDKCGLSHTFGNTKVEIKGRLKPGKLNRNFDNRSFGIDFRCSVLPCQIWKYQLLGVGMEIETTITVTWSFAEVHGPGRAGGSIFEREYSRFCF